jgi:hypothetical protein
VLASEDRIIGIQDGAGVGKTTTLAVIREVSQQHGYDVRGYLAPTSRAAQQLGEAGISSQTIQAELVRGREQDSGSPRLYVIDEASLASTRFVCQPSHCRELLVDGVGGQTSSFKMHAISDHYNAVESEAGFRAVPCDELLAGVLVDTA